MREQVAPFGIHRLHLGLGPARIEPALVDLHEIEAPLNELLHVPLLVAESAHGIAATIMRTGRGVHAELQALGMRVVRQRLHATRESGRVRPQFAVRPQLRVAPTAIHHHVGIPGVPQTRGGL